MVGGGRVSHRERRLAEEGPHLRWAAAVHGAAALTLLLGTPGLVLGPLLLWLWQRRRHAVVDEAGRAALDFQLTVLLAQLLLGLAAGGVGAVFAFAPLPALLLGSPFAVLLHALWLLLLLADAVLVVRAVRATLAGEHVSYPLAIRILSPEERPAPPRS